MLWLKALHILFMTAWFAGLFYLPRIYVNLAQADEPPVYATLLAMATRLYRFMTPLGVLALIFGLLLWLGYGIGQGQLWLHIKLLFVIILLVYHLFCRHYLRVFSQHQNRHSHKFYRWFNEIPVLLLLVILFLVVLKPL